MPKQKRQRSARDQSVADDRAQSMNPSEEAVRNRAYEIYLHRDATIGSDVDDWLQAERELKPERV